MAGEKWHNVQQKTPLKQFMRRRNIDPTALKLTFAVREASIFCALRVQRPKKRCQQPCCWKSALGVRCACPGKKGKGRCAKTPKQAAKRARKGGLEDALGLRDALYPGQTVRDGARAQYEARYGTLRRAGQGVRQQPTFVELPPRQRQRPKRLGF